MTLPFPRSKVRPDPTGSLSESERIAWLRLARSEAVGPVTFYRLIELYGSAEQAIERLPELSRRGGRARPLHPADKAVAERELEAVRKIGGRILCAAESDYSLPLGAIEDAPPVLTVLGDPRWLKAPCIGVVGSRSASLNGRRFAQTLAKDLTQAGYVVASGLARGIDTAAHEGALSGGTIAVVAGGADIVYPEENRALYDKICAQGCVVAESPLGQQPFAQSFPRRNRIISGLSQGVAVVEASLRSGSLITARMAAEQGRDVFAVPGFPGDPRAQGPNALIRDGATLIRDAADLIETLKGFSGKALCEPSQPGNGYAGPAPDDEKLLDAARADIAAQLSVAPLAVDELIRACQWTIPVVQTVLVELELAGRLHRHPGGRVSLAVEGFEGRNW